MLSILVMIVLGLGFFTLFGLLIGSIIDEQKLKRAAAIRAREKSGPTICAICHDNGWEFQCRCGTSYHRECWNGLRRCATLGCPVTQEEVRGRIAKRAYYLYTESGCQHGRDKQHWIDAERRVLSGIL